ncbi:MAG: hypothetical protein QMD46_02755 [Methanomicrobiales archaeon]|nr:hypothetical protein [Methanomicrobiales archaeon]MDI6875360.1 hypothetical protein [Methanomicrobiales archaeon]
MVDPINYLFISITCFCFGLLVSFQISHIHHVRRLTQLARRCLDTGTIAPILVALKSETESGG